MRRIEYNISSQRRINRPRYGTIMLILLLLSCFFLFAAIKNLSVKSVQHTEEMLQLKTLSDQLDSLTRRVNRGEEDINSTKKRWNSRVRFANTLIKRKSTSILGKLDTLETLMPADSYISEVFIPEPQKNTVEIKTVSYSLSGLLDIYRKFSDRVVRINNENSKDGLWTCHLTLKLSDTEQAKDEEN